MSEFGDEYLVSIDFNFNMYKITVYSQFNFES